MRISRYYFTIQGCMIPLPLPSRNIDISGILLVVQNVSLREMIKNSRIEELYLNETLQNPRATINNHVQIVLQELENECNEIDMDIDIIIFDSKTRKRLIKKTIETRKKELKNGKENRLDSWCDECFATLTPKNIKVKANLAVG